MKGDGDEREIHYRHTLEELGKEPGLIGVIAGCSRLRNSLHSLIMSGVVTQNPEVLGGEPVFAGTRVPAKSLFDHLEAGDSIEQFLEGFPSVKREQVIALLEESRAHVLAAH